MSAHNSQLAQPDLFLDRLMDVAAQSPDLEALADIGISLSYGELVAKVARMAGYLQQRGLTGGQRVAILARNSVFQLIVHFAAQYAGGISVPLSPATGHGRLKNLLDLADPAILICGSGLEKATANLRELNSEMTVLTENALNTVMGLNTEGAVIGSEKIPDSRVLSDIASLMPTTGSTGASKLVVISHRGLANALHNIIEFVGYDGTNREAVVLPLSHSFGLGHVYCTLATGGFVWVDDGLKRVGRVLRALTEHNINGFPATPSMFNILMGPYRPAFASSAQGLKYTVVNSAPLPPEMTIELRAALPALQVLVYFGLTEASRSTFINLSEEKVGRYSSVGRQSPNVVVEIRDEEGTVLAPGNIGEVWIGGDHLADGYWKQPEETGKVFRDGWLRTGDLGVVDADGYLSLSGRSDDQINVGGLKLMPSEVERVIGGISGVADVAVAGITDAGGIEGTVVGAMVVTEQQVAISNNDILHFCSEKLEPYMVPRRIIFVDALPRAESGKILRADVQKMLESALAESGGDP